MILGNEQQHLLQCLPVYDEQEWGCSPAMPACIWVWHVGSVPSSIALPAELLAQGFVDNYGIGAMANPPAVGEPLLLSITSALSAVVPSQVVDLQPASLLPTASVRARLKHVVKCDRRV